jgi:hypothetical protein
LHAARSYAGPDFFQALNTRTGDHGSDMCHWTRGSAPPIASRAPLVSPDLRS